MHFETSIDSHRLPGIARATLEMSYCNGGVNRDRSERDVLRDLESVIDETAIAFDLPAISAWLMALDDDTLSTVVDGEQTEMTAALTTAPPGTDMFLTAVFNGAA